MRGRTERPVGAMSALAPCLMVQGTASGVGKSLLAAALCRIFARAGYRVAPFKSQNMALNAAVTLEGGEIGRAQAAQAAAAGIEPTVDMNPILLKPEPGYRSQIVVRGRAVGSVTWREYQRMQAELLPIVADSLARLRRTWDLLIIEGAGSPAEINLRDSDIVNMKVARLADAPVLLVGDIDRGGVFAALLGTLALLDPPDRARVGGLIVNRFRGDEAVLAPGLAELAARAGVPVLGVVPYLDARLVPSEDSLDLDEPARWGAPGALDVAVVRLPLISNFDDFEPLAAEPGVAVRYVRGADELRGADLIVLPGSKGTASDLRWLFDTGLAYAIQRAGAEGRPSSGSAGATRCSARSCTIPIASSPRPLSRRGSACCRWRPPLLRTRRPSVSELGSPSHPCSFRGLPAAKSTRTRSTPDARARVPCRRSRSWSVAVGRSAMPTDA